MATLDSRTSLACRELDGKDFAVAEARAGVNYPPMHPRCRSTTIEHDPDGKADWFTSGQAMQENMSYEGWFEKHRDTIEAEQKKAYNAKRDEKQFERYKAVLGADAPKDLNEFQEIKQNNPEYYKFLKLDFKRRNDLIQHPEKALPNAKTATAADAKFEKYFFNPDNEDGWAKGKAFTSRLGYDISNWEDLQSELVSRASLYPSTRKNEDLHGIRYEQKMVLYGSKSKPANVVVGWKVKEDKTWMTSAYIKEVKESEDED